MVRMKALLAAHLAFKKHILSGLKEYGIMPGHPQIMHYIMLHEGCQQKDIANNCYVESATLSSVLSNMERRGLIERRRSSADKRSYSIYPKTVPDRSLMLYWISLIKRKAQRLPDLLRKNVMSWKITL